jgi:hypothetical protein
MEPLSQVRQMIPGLAAGIAETGDSEMLSLQRRLSPSARPSRLSLRSFADGEPKVITNLECYERRRPAAIPREMEWGFRKDA